MDNVSKFYFCEGCGKRITDKQIEEGQGRDKKLKGVYCKDCATGVMTIEFDAITDVAIPETVSSARPPTGANAREPKHGAKGPAMHAAATRTPAHPTEKIHPGHAPSSKHQRRIEQPPLLSPMAILGIVAVVVTVAVAIIVLASGHSPAPPRTPVAMAPVIVPNVEKPIETQPPPINKVSVPEPAPPVAAAPAPPPAAPAPAPEPVQSVRSQQPDADLQKRADAAFVELTENLKTTESKSRKYELVNIFLRNYPQTSAAHRVVALRDELQAAPDDRKATPSPAAPVKDTAYAGGKRPNVVSMAAVREAYALLSAQQEKSAQTRLEQARDDKELTSADLRQAFEKDIQLSAWVGELRKALTDGAALVASKHPAFILKRDKEKDLPTGPGTKNTVRAFQDEEFVVEQDLGGGVVTFKIPLAVLQAANRTELTVLGLPPSPDTPLKLIFSELLAYYANPSRAAADQLRKRIQAAEKAGASAELCAHFHARMETQEREFNAAEAFAKIKSAVEAARSTESGKLIASFMHDFGDTLVCDANKATLYQWIAEIAEKNDPLKQPGPVTDAWVAAVAALPVGEQFKYVEAKLRELNPKMRGVSPVIANGKITGLRGTGANISNTTPLRALTSLSTIELPEPAGHEGKFDLAPLVELPLKYLELYNLRVPDFAPLRGSKVETLNIGGVNAPEWSPLEEMPNLKEIGFDGKPTEKQAEVLRRCKALERINGKPAQDFLKNVVTK